MAVALLPDALWDLVEPFLAIPPRRPKGGRPRVSDRACLTGIVFVLRSGIPWQMLPAGTRVRIGDDVLAAPARLATGGRVGSDPLCAAGLARSLRPD
jgi:transposase